MEQVRTKTCTVEIGQASIQKFQISANSRKVAQKTLSCRMCLTRCRSFWVKVLLKEMKPRRGKSSRMNSICMLSTRLVRCKIKASPSLRILLISMDQGTKRLHPKVATASRTRMLPSIIVKIHRTLSYLISFLEPKKSTMES